MPRRATKVLPVEASFTTMTFEQLVADLYCEPKTIVDAIRLVQGLWDLHAQPATKTWAEMSADDLTRNKELGKARAEAFRFSKDVELPRCSSCGWLRIPTRSRRHATCSQF